MSKFLRVLGDPNEREVKAHLKAAARVNEFEPRIQALSDQELTARAVELREQFVREQEENPERRDEVLDAALAAALPEVFALTREASRRVIGLRHFDVQLVGGMVLHEGKIAEMKTGEGKTLVATLALVLNAFGGRGAHLVTVNDYLAQRDAGWMAPIYRMLGLSTSVIVGPASEGQVNRSFIYDPEFLDESHRDPRLQHLRPCNRAEGYGADITYGTNNEFGFDYLRDNMAVELGQCVQRELAFAIVDEVDSILIDEARTPLIISGQGQASTEKYQQYARLIPRLKVEEDYTIDEKSKSAALTEEGIAKMERMTGIQNLYDVHNFEEAHQINQALRAHALYQRDRDYVVDNGNIVIVDEFTGRKMPGRRWSDGLHQAIEAREGVKVQQEMRTMATITFQNYFRLYRKLCGMTGTAITEAEEFHKIYELEVVVIPTNRPMVRRDDQDMIFRTEAEKYDAVVSTIAELSAKGQPVLVGTVSIEKSERLARLLEKRGVTHNVLNAKQHEREALIVADAGKTGAVTIATNMAGRGTDIVLGEGVRELGGLFILGTERHESRRIDNQLRGRAGRQGDPGASRFYLSLEDDLFRIFMGERMKKFVGDNMAEGEPLEHKLLSRSIEQAQSKVEGFHFDARRHVVEYDDVMNKQREIIYGERRRILEGIQTRENILTYAASLIEDAVTNHCQERHAEMWDWDGLLTYLSEVFPFPAADAWDRSQLPTNRDQLIGFLRDLAETAYDAKEAELGAELMGRVEQFVMLRAIDVKWVDYLTQMEGLKESIGLRAYGQRDPLVEYKNEAFHAFQKLLEEIKADCVTNIYRVQVTVTNDPPPAALPEATPGVVSSTAAPMPGSPVAPMATNPVPVGAASVPSLPNPVGVATRPAPPSATGAPLPAPRPVGSAGPLPPTSAAQKVGRNDPCWCGSGRKFKRCHGA